MKFSRFGFGSGLMSRDLAGRVDVDGVSRACVEMKNFELLQSGAVRRRFGSRWLADLSGRPVAICGRSTLPRLRSSRRSPGQRSRPRDKAKSPAGLVRTLRTPRRIVLTDGY